MTSDPVVEGIRRGFDTSILRVRAAPDPLALVDEIVAATHHFYRLAEVVRLRHGNIAPLDPIPGARGLLWVRGADTHQAVSVVSTADVYVTYYPAFYGVGVWLSASGVEALLPKSQEKFTRNRRDYEQHLEAQLVETSLRWVFDAVEQVV
ncbi:hypothetical protein [Kineococcus terrestris]|uniref:hypothetical protein n=1 Tax=Kineococcus terrestris TaxID=2044856 RepID=UPI0034DAC41A